MTDQLLLGLVISVILNVTLVRSVSENARAIRENERRITHLERAGRPYA